MSLTSSDKENGERTSVDEHKQREEVQVDLPTKLAISLLVDDLAVSPMAGSHANRDIQVPHIVVNTL